MRKDNANKSCFFIKFGDSSIDKNQPPTRFLGESKTVRPLDEVLGMLHFVIGSVASSSGACHCPRQPPSTSACAQREPRLMKAGPRTPDSVSIRTYYGIIRRWMHLPQLCSLQAPAASPPPFCTLLVLIRCRLWLGPTCDAAWTAHHHL
jgi:hypothetical protein